MIRGASGISAEEGKPLFKKISPFWLGFTLFAFSIALIASGIMRPGLTWDEPIYAKMGKYYIQWFTEENPFERETISKHWWAEHAHPPLGKLWIGLWTYFFEKSFPQDPVRAYYIGIIGARFGASVLFSILAVAIFAFARGIAGDGVGFLSALIFLFLPRIFLHAHIAALDVPMTLMWLLAAWAFLKAMERRSWVFWAGFFFGLALLTKVNAFLLPLALWPWGLICYKKKAVPAIISMLVVGTLLFIGLWPRMWLGPFEIFRLYILDKIARTIVPVFYLGETYRDSYAPWHYPFVLTFVTVPAGLLIGFILETFKVIRGKSVRFAGFLLWNVIAVLVGASLPGVAKYDGVRLYLPLFPFLSILSALGINRVWKFLRGKISRPLVPWFIAALFLFSQFSPALLLFPYNLSYYNGLVGWGRGASRLGFETTYWGEACDERILLYLRESLPEGSTVSFEGIGQLTAEFANLWLKEDVRIVYIEEEPDFIVLLMRQGWFEDFHWKLFREESPIFGNYTFFGKVPVCLVYDMRGKW